MVTIAIALGFAGIATFAGLAIAASLRHALPHVQSLRAQLASCPDKLTLRYTLTETVSRWDDGTVVPLPIKRRLPAPHGLRAAA